VTGEGIDGSLDYTLTLLAVETRLAYRNWFDASIVPTGHPIALNTRLSFGGKPVSGADITVEVARPGEGFGNVMFHTEFPSADGDLPPLRSVNPDFAQLGSDAVPTLVAYKEQFLLENENFKVLQPRPDGQLNVDEVYKGLYRAQYTDTQTPGEYKFLIRIRLDIEGEIIERVETHSVTVRILEISYEGSGFNFAQGQLVMTLRDRFKNYLGPGYHHKLRIIADDNEDEPLSMLDPNARGIYHINVQGRESSELKIFFGPTLVVRGTAEAIAAGKGTVPDGREPRDGTPIDDLLTGCLTLILRLLRSIRRALG
jgi:hypothetical protein